MSSETDSKDSNCLLVKAAHFAAVKHKDQRRKDPEATPYINHPLGVANILVEEGGITSPPILVAAILHDTVEDTNTTFNEITALFGEEICGIVKEVTDDKSQPSEVRKKAQVDSAPHKTWNAKQVKLADKLYNLRDLERATPSGWTEQRKQEYFQWGFDVVAGLRGANPRLEAKLDEVFQRKGIIPK